MRQGGRGVAFGARQRLARLGRWLGEPAGATPLVVFRIGFGLIMCLAAVRFLMKGWVRTQFIEPTFHFRYFLFEWVPALPGGWIYPVFGIQIACAAMIALGWHYRAAAAAFFLAFSYVELLDQATYLNHYYFISLVAFLLVLLPLHRWGSVDAARRGSDRTAPARWIALVLKAQIAIVYFFAGVAKLNPDWLLRAEPLGTWLSARTGLPLAGVLFDQPWFAYLMSWGGAAFDLSIPALLLWRASRPWAYLAVAGFHLTTAVLFPIGVFPWVMMAAALVFFDEADYRRICRFFRAVGSRFGRASHARARGNRRRPAPGPALPVGGARGVVLASFLALQIFLPLRHWAYPGDVLWTEEGFRFSWRVMVAEKTGAAFFRVTDPRTELSWEAFPADYLTPQQERQFAFQPDMILSFAHHLRDKLREAGVADPEIRARVYVSLNGERSRLLVDPAVDLAKTPKSLAPKEWVLARRGRE